jgi:hypothetical protein
MVVTKDLLDLTLKSRDHISALLDASAGCGEADRQTGDVLIAGLRRLVPAGLGIPGGPSDSVIEPLSGAQTRGDRRRPGGSVFSRTGNCCCAAATRYH